jgi:hypothetical protein
VLYVGKAKNLRKRLGSYRVANPDRMPRRHLRMLRAVERIELQECPDETSALARESELLRALKPRFNRAGTWPATPRFLVWRSRPDGVELAVTENPEAGWQAVGPSGAQMIYFHRALVRLLWCRLRPDRGLASMPTGWFRGEHGGRVLIFHTDSALGSEASRRLLALADGQFDAFQQWLLPPATSFEQQSREEDVTFLVDQLARGPARNNVGSVSAPSCLATDNARVIASGLSQQSASVKRIHSPVATPAPT